MRRWFGVVAVAILCGAADGGSADPRLADAQAAYDEAKRLSDAGKYPEAIARAERSLALREAALGPAHLEVARSLLVLGGLYRAKGEMAKAEPLLQRALQLREAALGKDHPDVGEALNALGKLYADQGAHDRAQPLLERALAVREGALGKDHLDVAITLNNLANLYRAQAQFAKAEPLYQRALSIRESKLGDAHRLVAQTIGNLAVLYAQRGDLDQAAPMFERARAVLEKALGPEHPDVAAAYNNLGAVYQELGDPDRAEKALQRALAIREKVLGPGHPDLATTLDNLGALYSHMGLWARAIEAHQRALQIGEAALGGDSPLITTSMVNLAHCYMEVGKYAESERLDQRALKIREAKLGSGHPQVADSLNNLSTLYREQGFYDRARPQLERARSIWESSLGKNNPRVAIALTNLAVIDREEGRYKEAKALLQQALAILEVAPGKHPREIANTLDAMGTICLWQGREAEAQPFYERALAIDEAAFGKDSLDVGRVLHNLAQSYEQQGKYAQAEPLLLRSSAIWTKQVGTQHPLYAESLSLRADLRLGQHRIDDAVAALAGALEVDDRRLRLEAVDFSEVALARFLEELRGSEERLYSLARLHPDHAGVRRLALSAALMLRGRSAEELADTSRVINRSLGAEDRSAFGRLRDLRAQLATLTLDGPGRAGAGEYERRLRALADQGDALEAELAQRSAPLRTLRARPGPAELPDRVAAALPVDAAKVEDIASQDRPLRSHGPISRAAGEPRYLALMLFPGAKVRAFDLGPAAPIDLAATRLRDALANRDATYLTQAQALHRLVLQPLLPALGATKRLVLVPDGQLSLVPFAVLRDGKRFLMDAFELDSLTSGAELLPRETDPAPPSSVVVMADPDYGTAPGAAPPPPAMAERSGDLERFFSAVRSGAATRGRWVPLPGTRQEAEAIQKLVPRAQVLLGAEASKDRLLNLPTPGVLHLATHGFFLEDAAPPAGARGVAVEGSSGSAIPRSPDPLLRSGLLLAGASGDSPALERSLVTALELAGLNLWGTQLVVLSACDTGRGEVHLGQGVYGLRRAFVVAGAETVVMSLWQVNDETTHGLMAAYYRHLTQGEGRAAALAHAMRELRASRPHPYYWAPFISIGRDGPVRALEAGAP